MMKLCLCFLVLAFSSLSRGQHDTNDSPESDLPTPSPLSPDVTQNEESVSVSLPHSPANQTSENATHPLPTNSTVIEESAGITEDVVKPTVGVNGSTAGQTNATVIVPGGRTMEASGDLTTTVSNTPSEPVTTVASGNSSWGYVILVFIVLIIIALCVILYFLRRVSRSYSFDLHRPSPVNNLNEATGTFEAVYLDDLDRPAPKDQMNSDDLSPPAVTNGTTLPAEEKSPNEESAQSDQPNANGVEPSSPTTPTCPTSDTDPADKPSSPSHSNILIFDAIMEEAQNVNDNNPSLSSIEPFVEINLEDPAWCDQLLTSPEAPSSVLPFTPFSFSSSSSTSSS